MIKNKSKKKQEAYEAQSNKNKQLVKMAKLVNLSN